MSAFIMITARDAIKVTLAVDAIESITEQRGWTDTARIVMKSGQVYIADASYRSVIDAISDAQRAEKETP